MSTLKVDGIRHNSATSDAITTHSDGTASAKIIDVGGGALSHRNILINGAMTVSQRGSTHSHTSSNNNTYTLDRWRTRDSGLDFDCTITQSTDSPDGFRYSLKITPDATETPSASNNGFITQQPLGETVQHFAHGTSSAKSMTLSFYAKTGSQNSGHQYSLQIRKYDSSGNRKVVLQAFTVTSSWQRFTMTFPGDTATAINNSNDYQGMEINWHLCTGPDDLTSAQPTWGTPLSSYWAGVTGQSNFMDNTNNEFYLTGCQLEVGDTATSFEHRSFDDELRRCQYYYNKVYDVEGQSGEKPFVLGTYLTNSELACVVNFPKMRVVPSLDITNGTSKFMIRRSSVSDHFDTLTMRYGTTTTAELYTGSGVSGTQGECGIIRGADTDVYIAFTAEI